MDQNSGLPLALKEKLLTLAKRLPEAARSDFVRNAARRLSDVAVEHPNTIVFGIAGLVLGEMMDNLLSIPLPFTDDIISLTGDHADKLFGVIGGLYGFSRDKARQQVHETMRIIGEELRSALAK